MNKFKEMLCSWNEFWFHANSTMAPFFLRTLIGIAAFVVCVHHALYTPAWLGTDGWLNATAGKYIIGDGVQGTGAEYRWTLFYMYPNWIAPLCWLGAASSLLMIAGRGSRIGAFVAFCILAMLHHRAPLLVGRGEPLLVAVLLYCLLIPSYPLEKLWQSIRSNRLALLASTPGASSTSSIGFPSSWTIQFAYRLIQIQFTLWMLFSLISMLGYSGWWTGEAVRQLIADRQGFMPDKLANVTVAELLAHLTILVQIGILTAILVPKMRFLAPLLLAVFLLAILLVIGDFGYIAILLASSSFLWIPNRSFVCPSTS